MRIANKTTIRFDDTSVEFGAFGVDRHLMHPIFQWLDYQYKDYGGFAAVTDDRIIGGYRNRLIAGVNILNGSIDNTAIRQLSAGDQGRAAIVARCEKPENTPPMSRTRSISCRPWRSWPARSILHADARADGSTS